MVYIRTATCSFTKAAYKIFDGIPNSLGCQVISSKGLNSYVTLLKRVLCKEKTPGPYLPYLMAVI